MCVSFQREGHVAVETVGANIGQRKDNREDKEQLICEEADQLGHFECHLVEYDSCGHQFGCATSTLKQGKENAQVDTVAGEGQEEQHCEQVSEEGRQQNQGAQGQKGEDGDAG